MPWAKTNAAATSDSTSEKMLSEVKGRRQTKKSARKGSEDARKRSAARLSALAWRAESRDVVKRYRWALHSLGFRKLLENTCNQKLNFGPMQKKTKDARGRTVKRHFFENGAFKNTISAFQGAG
jgi:hypothetical protein